VFLRPIFAIHATIPSKGCHDHGSDAAALRKRNEFAKDMAKRGERSPSPAVNLFAGKGDGSGVLRPAEDGVDAGIRQAVHRLRERPLVGVPVPQLPVLPPPP